ncbi:voltage-gated potassium channel [Sulfodiicoccus acidiphilus]|uniref:Voltage-gated potassium channel n=1 Tax=Sulfodiicoccus acidiphilus TaxID=1670455 RepID=A0A348B533_9CREN|nr:aldo/keto reductase [Sulfodiicoccus acidiphilus]BBD73285.1 voltage-gated potassium channel [Sulfodiicoccus acidiphilus]GGT89362.1 voltage-gated potassium channel [Sulfodiicoccus acidiphilus]
MNYSNFGESGLKVSTLCLGLWHLPPSKEVDQFGVPKVDEELSIKIIRRAVDLGVNFIDTANVYHGVMQGPDWRHTGNAERILGKALQGMDRESLVISTKVRGRVADHPNGEGLSRKHLMWQVRESLKRMGLNYIDVYLMHRPDPSTPIEETLETMADLVRQGLVHYVGESYFSPEDVPYMVEVSRDLRLPFLVMQEPYNLLEREAEVDKFPLARAYGLGVMAYIPLAQGVLTGKYANGVPEGSRATYVPEISSRYLTRETLDALKEFHSIAQEVGVKDAQLALAWILKRAQQVGVTVVPIIGSTSLAQLEEDVEAVDVKLSDDVMKRLDEVSRKARVNWTVKYDRVKRRGH